MKKKSNTLDISVVVPVYNELENAPLLYQSIKDVAETLDRSYEIIFVDDGSQDGTRDVLREIAGKDETFRAILFYRNFGQSAAMAAGFRHSRGEIVITMDGDLQNDPKDIPLLLKKMAEGYDVVSGWRKNRKDKLFIRKVPSRIANRLICNITDVRLHDTGCALKAYRREVVQKIRLYGELHRFLPALARVEGARITEVVARHHHRRFGQSKYNLTRTFRVLMDLSSLNLFLKYLRNPLQFFGRIGVWLLGLGLVTGLVTVWHLVRKSLTFADVNVEVTLLFLLLVAGFQFIFMGLVASLVVKTGERRGAGLAPRVIEYKKD